uniref:Golgin subfamily A member 7 n=1 Tax=Oncorhynchus tshawytscha TaxID=74940 RepID=A0AAZ3SGL2_ONCTS
MAEAHNLQDLQHQAAVASKVYVQRDYNSGTICRFQTKFPSELEARVDRQQFEETMQTLNNLYAEAEKIGGKSYLEGCLACMTAYTIFLCMETHYEKVGPSVFSIEVCRPRVSPCGPGSKVVHKLYWEYVVIWD